MTLPLANTAGEHIVLIDNAPTNQYSTFNVSAQTGNLIENGPGTTSSQTVSGIGTHSDLVSDGVGHWWVITVDVAVVAPV